MTQGINDVEVYQRTDGRWDFRIIAAENGNILASSDQGYENREVARQIGVRVTSGHLGVVTFAPHDPTTTEVNP